GTRKGLEADVIPKAGIQMTWISIGGLRGKGVMRLIAAPFVLTLAIFQALIIFIRYRPGVVLGMGGFAAGPGGVVACLLRLPLVIHEQNSVAGFTNRLLSRCASCILEAFPDTFAKHKKVLHTGNPVRTNIAGIKSPEERFSQRDGGLRLLVLGGSQGAMALNEMLPKTLASMEADIRPEVWHQTGLRHIEATRSHYKEAQIEARVDAFIENMAEAYEWADLVLCRAGALTIAELTAVGVPAILVPFPHAVDDHQTHNAEYMVKSGGAIMISQEKLTIEHLASVLRDFYGKRNQLLLMAHAAHSLARPHATRAVAEVCLGVAK
ncbi:MAG: undecaprenyldiphospho-muramoylpentapeptide beta-N-acetylglucosaminyltransferase, partial [Gammaproteobacteria bacterium]|nr:undecaprenyldiphospho-muramoylpentapeptide beta-N-acetylglucosaminyltransferase [Gammaproteobacteria bacterium]